MILPSEALKAMQIGNQRFQWFGRYTVFILPADKITIKIVLL